jgi:adenosylcobinamide-GDP ribazoletransferase
MINNLLAAFTIFTRLPAWRLRGRALPPESFSRAVDWWPVVGLATGGVAAGVLWCAAAVFPMMAAAVMAFAARALFTGAFHEDGLGDFFDGFGGGRTRERTLEIMKDSRAGSYGVVGLVLYFLLVTSLVAGLPREMAVVVVFVGDPLSKAIAGQLVNVLPYARREEDGKIGTAYRRMGFGAFGVVLVAGFAPAALLLPREFWWAVAAPFLVFMGLVWMMRRRIGGYTGDCCGATFLLCEAAFYIGIWGALSWA